MRGGVYLLGEIDFMVQEGGLCGRGRYYRDLYQLSINPHADQQRRQTYSLVVQK